MAIAGLHNVSVLDSSFLREPQSEVVTVRGDDGSSSTRASSVLQMWRELEDEHAVSHDRERLGGRVLNNRSDGMSSDLSRMDMSESHGSEHSGTLEDMSVSENDYGQWSPGPIGSENGHEDSSDLGEIERVRVRQIFREWMNCAARERTSNISWRSNGSRAQWLGETEQERVRIIREWVQMNNQQRGTCVDNREEHGAELVGQIEQVLDGSVVNPTVGQIEHTRRGNRRLCGRQALLDMLKKAERERQHELQVLLECRAVSQFAHRNRIQSLLRGRFLRNDRIEDKRPTSTAARELGLLRQRHTVADLREGFFSRLDHSICGQVCSSTSDTSSNTDINGKGSEQTQANNPQQVVDESDEQTESNVEETDNHRLSDDRTDIGSNIIEDRSSQDSTSASEARSGQVLEDEIRDRQQSMSPQLVESRNGIGEEVNGNWREGANENVVVDNIHLPSTGEVFSQLLEPNGDENSAPMLSNHVDDLEGNVIEDENQHGSAALTEQWQSEVLGSEDGGLFADGFGSNEWRDGTQNSIDVDQHEIIGNEWLVNDDREEASEVWHQDGGFQEAVQSWLEEPSEQESVPVGRMDPFYLPDDDNVYNTELRELLNRRSVSTLLRSGFRESLDQLIQSYVERQSHAPLDWELQGTLPTPALPEQEQHSGDQNEGQRVSVQNSPHALPSPSIPPVQRLWDHEPQHFTWSQHDMHQRFGIDWDIINDLRIDMARLQQRMNNMQRMLEACMDMQLELQRSIRQEVSAALNRPSGSSGTCENGLPEDRSKWDHVRKGICCVCCDSTIDSLLYRCGHMCTCSTCANELVQKGEKCPMCRAPVIEVIRAYSIL